MPFYSDLLFLKHIWIIYKEEYNFISYLVK